MPAWLGLAKLTLTQRPTNLRIPVLIILAHDWTLRACLRAELRERGINALGMDSTEDIGRVLADGRMPALIVAEATSEFADSRAIQALLKRVPAILIASRTDTVALPPAAAVFYRPVSIGQIVSRVRELLEASHAA
jgi:hypothetical protein